MRGGKKLVCSILAAGAAVVKVNKVCSVIVSGCGFSVSDVSGCSVSASGRSDGVGLVGFWAVLVGSDWSIFCLLRLVRSYNRSVVLKLSILYIWIDCNYELLNGKTLTTDPEMGHLSYTYLLHI